MNPSDRRKFATFRWLTELWLAAEELLFGLGAGRNGTKGGAALDKVDAG